MSPDETLKSQFVELYKLDEDGVLRLSQKQDLSFPSRSSQAFLSRSSSHNIRKLCPFTFCSGVIPQLCEALGKHPWWGRGLGTVSETDSALRSRRKDNMPPAFYLILDIMDLDSHDKQQKEVAFELSSAGKDW